MAESMIAVGWLLDLVSIIWIVLILSDLIVSWLIVKKKTPGVFSYWLNRISEPPVNVLRKTLPTVYRGVDFAPWLTILFLVLIKTFALRAMIYWGMLNRSVGL